MAYCTLADILDNLDEAELVRYTDDADVGDANIDVVDNAIEGAGALIDSYLASRHSVPMDPVPDIVTALAVDIAIYKIASRRGRESDSVRRKYEDALKFLKDVAAGKAMIPGATDANASASRDRAEISGEPRIFTRPKMAGF